MVTSLIIPWRTDHDQREAIWCYLEEWRGSLGFELCVADSGHEPFNQAASRNKAVAESTGDLLVILDADVLVDRQQLRNAVALTEANWMIWTIPYIYYVELSAAVTKYALDHDDGRAYHLDRDCIIYPTPERWGQSISGALVVSRAIYELVGGYDERFVTWGFEDQAIYLALETLVGRGTRLGGRLDHFWHPWNEYKNGRLPEPEMQTLFDRYQQAFGDKNAMARLCTEHDFHLS